MSGNRSAFDILMNKSKANKLKPTDNIENDIIVIEQQQQQTKKSQNKENKILNSNQFIKNKCLFETKLSSISSLSSIDYDYSHLIGYHYGNSRNNGFSEDTLITKGFSTNNSSPKHVDYLNVNISDLSSLIDNSSISNTKNYFKEIKNKKEIDLQDYLNNDKEWIDFFNKQQREQDDLKETNRTKRRKLNDGLNENDENERDDDNSLLWTDKYSFKNDLQFINNSQQYKKLKEWLEQFKHKKQQDKSKESSSTSSPMDDSDESDDCSVSSGSSGGPKYYKNAILLNGHVSCGKTSVVYSIAKSLNFKVFEVNTSNLRNKYQIMQDLLETLTSHHVTTKNMSIATKIKANINNFDDDLLLNDDKFKLTNELFNKYSRKRRRRNQQTEQLKEQENSSKKDTRTKIDLLKDSLILFDDFDIVLKDDKEFWSCIKYFIKQESKKPIILTSNESNILKKLNLNIQTINFNKHTSNHTSKLNTLMYLKWIAFNENIYILNDFYLKQLLLNNNYDLRQSIIQLQFDLLSFKYLKKSNKNEAKMDSESIWQNNNNIDLFEFKHYIEIVNKKKSNQINCDNQLTAFKLKDGLVDDVNIFKYTNNYSSKIDNDICEYLNNNLNLNDPLIENQKKNNESIDLINNKYLLNNLKIYSNKNALCLDYRPYFYQICSNENFKQQNKLKQSKRYLHYLNKAINYFDKDDYLILSHSALTTINQSHAPNIKELNANNIQKYVDDDDLYST